MTVLDSPTDSRHAQVRRRPPRWEAALSGVAGAGLALGLTELAAGLFDGMPSLLDSVAAQVIQVLPGGLLTWGIETFGESDRAVIGTSIALVVLLIGAFAGLARRAGRTTDVALFGAFALLGAGATLADINTNFLVVLLVVAVSAGAGFMTMRWLIDVAPPSPSPDPVDDATPATSAGATPPAAPTPPARADDGDHGDAPNVTIDRRKFLAAAGAVGGVAALGVAGGRALAGRSVATAAGPVSVSLPSVAEPLPPVSAATSFDVDGLSPLFVPNEDFYRIDTAVTGPPRVDLSTWEVRVHGQVRNEITLNFDDLVDRGLIEADVTIACVSNEVGGGLVGNARWTGVPLAPLLEEAGVLPGGGQLVGRAVDGFTVGFPTEIAMDGRDAMIAVAMNGEPLPVEHGFPARLIIPGLFGYVSATKWLSDIELTGWDDFDAYWVPRGWSKEGPIKTQSRIDTPTGSVAEGEVVVAGVAWAPTRGIDRVEVRVDDGDWAEAELAEAVNSTTWVQWQLPVTLDSGGHTLTVRATDGTGTTQSQDTVAPHPNGAEGWHSVRVRVG
ncbi:MAG TPA: molybdopterin-dependent oxidoreductase [Nitriliruptoraceae bacterium]|nr:molybdopterin-dependent oxidoreductase [Nitriliruptoraceae bacterium]